MQSSWKFILAPATCSAKMEKKIADALLAHKALLNSAVAKPLSYRTFMIASTEFKRQRKGLGYGVPLLGATQPRFINDIWWANLSAIGLTEAGIDLESVKEQINKFRSRSDLFDLLPICPDFRSSDPIALQEGAERFVRAVGHMLRAFECLLCDAERFRDGHDQACKAADCLRAAQMTLTRIVEDLPLPEIHADDQYDAWKFNIYHLVLRLLGYRPTC